MNDPLKAGLKTSEGILTALSVVVSAVVSLLVVLNVVNPADQGMIVELATKALTAVATLVVSGFALKEYIKGRTQIKIEQMNIIAEKQEIQG
jgi:hypothetical protein